MSLHDMISVGSGGLCRVLPSGIALPILLLLPLNASAEKAPGQRQVRVGIFQNEPIVFQDEGGTAKGLYVDLLNAIAEEEDWKIDYVLDTWNGCLGRLRDRDIDLMTCIAYAPERDSYADWSHEVVWTLWGVVYVHPESGIEDVPSLGGKRVAILKGGINGINFRKLCSAFNVTCDIVELSSHQAQLEAVEAGEVDAAVVNSVFGTLHGGEYRINETAIVFSPTNAFFAVPQGQSGDLDVIVDRYLTAWKKDSDSDYYQSLRRWLLMKEERSSIIPRWLVVLTAAFAAGVLILVLWTHLLGRAVRRRTQDLRISEMKYRTIIEGALDGVTVFDRTGRILEANEAYCRMIGYSVEELQRMTWCDIEAMESPAETKKHIEALIESGQGRFETRQRRKDGTAIDIEVSVRTISPEQGTCVTFIRDTTERNRAEAILEERERYYRTLILTLHEDIMVVDSEHRIVDVNNSFVNTTGHSREGAIGRPCYEIMHGSDVPCYKGEGRECRLRQVFDTGVAVKHQHVHVATDGSPLHVDVLLSPMKDADGNVTHVVEAVRDISDLVKSQNALHISEERFRMICDNAPVLIDAFDENGKCVIWNKHCRETFGWTIDEINEHGDAVALFYPDKAVRDEVLRTVTTDPDGRFREWHPVTKDGKKLTTLWANYRLPDGLVFNLGHDITERKKVEEERDRILELSTDLICVAGMDGFLRYVNPAWESLLGYTREELLARPFLDFIHPDDHGRNDAEVARLSQGLQTVDFENRYVCKDGSVQHMLWSATPLADEGLMYCIGRDITELKTAEEELARHRDHLEAEVQRRTAELEKTIGLMTGREIRMSDLKKENRVLRAQLEREGTRERDDSLPTAEGEEAHGT